MAKFWLPIELSRSGPAVRSRSLSEIANDRHVLGNVLDCDAAHMPDADASGLIHQAAHSLICISCIYDGSAKQQASALQTARPKHCRRPRSAIS